MKNFKIGMKALVSLICCTALALSVSCASESAALEKHPTPSEPKGPLKILAIGNSFSEDAVEQYLYELFAAAGQEVVVANMYKSGCKLEEHYQFINEGEAKYSYRKIVGGVKAKTDNVTLLHALEDEEWDYISIQQASGYSGLYDTYTPYLPFILKYVQDNAKGGKAKIIFHQTWAYDVSCNSGHFRNYDYDQIKMYDAIIDAVNKAVKDNPSIYLVVPSGTAIQNARTSFLGDSFNRDGSAHLETTYGRYTVACTWYETISGKSVVGNRFAPASVDIMEKAVAQNAAHYAVQTPGKITDMVAFRNPLNGSEEFDAPIYIDFGAAKSSSAKWFKVPPYYLRNSIYPKDVDDTYTPISITVMGGFSDTFNGSEDFASRDLVIGSVKYPKVVWEDALMVKSGDGPGILVLSGFDPALRYDLSILSLRFNQSSDSRVAEFVVEGIARSEAVQVHSDLKTIESGKDYGQYQVVYSSVAPSADGKITITTTCKTKEALLNAVIISKNYKLL